MSAETISVRNFLVTVSQAAYLEQAPMTLHFINCFSSYWRYISRPDKEAPLKQELDMLMLIREIFISIPFFQILDENLPEIPEELLIPRNCILAQVWETWSSSPMPRRPIPPFILPGTARTVHSNSPACFPAEAFLPCTKLRFRRPYVFCNHSRR